MLPFGRLLGKLRKGFRSWHHRNKNTGETWDKYEMGRRYRYDALSRSQREILLGGKMQGIFSLCINFRWRGLHYLFLCTEHMFSNLMWNLTLVFPSQYRHFFLQPQLNCVSIEYKCMPTNQLFRQRKPP